MPTLTSLTDDWNIDFINKIIQHKDMTIDWDTNTGTSAPLNAYIRGVTSLAVAKVIGGTTASVSATGTYILTNVKGRFEDDEVLETLDELGFDTIISTGLAIGDTVDEVGAGIAQIIVDFIEYNHPGDTAGAGTIYGRIQTSGFLNNDGLEVNSVQKADATGAEVVHTVATGLAVNETVTGTGTPFSISGVINYDAGTVDIPNDALVLSGVRATGVLTFTANPANTESITLGSKTYNFETTLAVANDVLIGAATIDTMRNLANAINDGPGKGTTYDNATVKNTEADIAVTGALTLEARAFIPNDTTVTSTDVGTSQSWDNVTLLTGSSGGTGRGRNHARTLDSVTATGTHIINDISGIWLDNDVVQIDQIVNYDTVEAGQAFAVGDVVQGFTSKAQGRILAVTSTRLILAEQTLRFEENESLRRVNIDQTLTDIADADFATGTLGDDEIPAITTNHPNSQPTPRVIQKQLLQGGIYNDSLNNVRHVRQLYNFIQDTWDELDQMDDTIPMSGQVKNAQYTLINGWFIPDRSMRFLDSGSIRDSTSDNVWANPQSLGTMEAVGATGYSANAVQPQLYIEQNGVFTDPQDVPALEGHINLLIKITSNTDTTLTATGAGAQIDSGRLRVYNRFFLHTYSHFFTATNDTGGVVTIALATSNDLNNTTETHDFAYISGAGTWNAGEEIVSDGAGTVADPIAVGVVVAAGTGTTGNVQYVLKSTATNFASPDVVTTQISQVTKQTNAAPTGVVAGYSDKIGFGFVDSNFTGGTTSGGPFFIGEPVTNASGSSGVILEDETGANTLYIDEDETDTAWDTSIITGSNSSATYNPTTRTADTVAPKDIGDEIDSNYGCVFGLDKTNSGSGRTIQELYEYTKYLTSKEADATFQLQAGRNQQITVQGRLYRKVDQSDTTPTFAEQVDAPYGIKAGALMLAARSVFIQDMANADIQNFNLIDEAGTIEVPPNIQTLEVTGLAVNDRVVTYETDGAASTTIRVGQYQVGTVGGGNNQSADSTIDLDAALDAVPMNADTPTTGTIRVEDPNNAGLFLNFTYGSRVKSSGIFTMDTTAEQPTPNIGDVTSSTNLVAADDAYVVLLSAIAASSTESATIEFVENLNIMTRVRKRGILPFEVTGTFNNSGASVAVIRTTDPVVDPV